MTNDTWQVIGNIASTTGVTAVAYSGVKGIVASYQTYISPAGSLEESERKLKRVRSRLQGLSPQRRENIETATRSNSFNCTSLEGLEIQLEILMDTHCRLSKRYDEASLRDRHNPYSEFRQNVSKLVSDARGLLNDTLTTTVPHIDDMGFNPNISRRTMARPPSPMSPITFLTPSPDAENIPMSPV